MKELTKGGDALELSTDINVITAEINAYQRVAGEAIFEIGKRLKHVKENDLVHGEYTGWLTTIGMTQPHANRFVRVYERFGKHSPGIDMPSNITILSLLAPFDDEELDKPREMPDGSTKKLTEMTRREIEEYKRKEHEAVKAREKAIVAADEAERRAEQAEAQAKVAQRSEELLQRRLEEIEDREPEVEIRTEYVEVDNTPHDYETIKQKLEAYNDKFGDIANYDAHITATHRQDMIVAVMSLSQGVREFAKRYTYMNEYKPVIDNLDAESKQQYDEAVSALKAMAESFGFTSHGKVSEVIDADYSELN